MGMHVLTNEIHAELVGFPLEVTSQPDCSCDPGSGCSSCGVVSVIIDAGERDDGAVGSRLVIRGTREQLLEAFTAAARACAVGPLGS